MSLHSDSPMPEVKYFYNPELPSPRGCESCKHHIFSVPAVNGTFLVRSLDALNLGGLIDILYTPFTCSQGMLARSGTIGVNFQKGLPRRTRGIPIYKPSIFNSISRHRAASSIRTTNLTKAEKVRFSEYHVAVVFLPARCLGIMKCRDSLLLTVIH